MMEHANGWMNGSMDGGTWIWIVVGVLAAVLLIIVIINQSNNRACTTGRRCELPNVRHKTPEDQIA